MAERHEEEAEALSAEGVAAVDAEGACEPALSDGASAASEASASPCTTKTRRGARWKPDSQRISSSLSAWAESIGSSVTCAFTRTHWP